MNANLLHVICTQIESGCNGIKCHNQLCHSNRSSIIDLKLHDAEFYYNRVIHSENPWSCVCSKMSPLIVNPGILDYIFMFNDSKPAFIEHGEITSNFVKALNIVLDDVDVLAHIFLSDDGHLSNDDLLIDYKAANEFRLACLKHSDKLLQFSNRFYELLQKMYTYPEKETYHYIRALIVLSLFANFFGFDNFAEVFFNYVVVVLMVENKKLFFEHLSKYKDLFENMLWIIQTNFTMFCASDFFHKHTPISKSIAKFLYYLSKSNKILEPTLFINETFTESLDLKDELRRWKNDNFSFLKYSSILSMSFRIEARSIERNLTREDGLLNIQVSRNNLLFDAIELLKLKTTELRYPIHVTFIGEDALDYGGNSREFLAILSKTLSNPEYMFLEKVNNGKYHWFNSNNNFEEDLKWFCLIGVVTALAIINKIKIPLQFPSLVFKKICKTHLTIDDLSEIDPDMAISLSKLRQDVIDGADISEYEIYFTKAKACFGEIIELPIVPSGETKLVTNSNLEEYIDAYIAYICDDSIHTQFQSFESGFNKVITDNIFKYFSPTELASICCGREDHNWDLMKNSTKYDNGYSANSSTIKYFWKVFNVLSEKEKKDLLFFITGSDCSIGDGLDEQNIITIYKSGDIEKLPTAHTCTKMLVLPDYQNEEKIFNALMICTENSTGFGFI